MLRLIDIGLVLVSIYAVLVVIGERRTLWMVRGLIVLMLVAALSRAAQLELLAFVLDKLVIGSAVAMALILQAEFRRLLEQLGRGEVIQLFLPRDRTPPKPNSVIDELVDAVKELSQNRTGALMILETSKPLDESNFSVPGVRLNAELSKELLQTIFQTTTLLHDGAVLIRASRIVSAGVILPISEKDASRQLGTRHRAAMGITERVENCICVVVSEETGSISVADGGMLNRPLTSSKLRDLLRDKFAPSADGDPVAPQLRSLGRRLSLQGISFFSALKRVLRLPSTTRKKNDS
ncbi:TIGR00159 family protein [Romeria aff. gracilis LEGE 07310]|uniref:Diadenylate cyclase n=1 Tax=Vasconcelosia minhoensis LEGE 07310 TaxID=915328 RepID=A0A8J7AXT6_9CYAN|nr:diadenylate cyclase CdaA [Romeria gracilis]MBE9078072.1 TIGR00159 family protein [Romeria aff. gracilis LEGE 07310]